MCIGYGRLRGRRGVVLSKLLTEHDGLELLCCTPSTALGAVNAKR